MSVMTAGDAYQADQRLLEVRAFLGDVVQICVVTSDIRRTIGGYLRMGIGPWRLQTLGPDTTSDTRFLGKPHDFSVRMAYAYSANMMWELVEPVDGDSSVARFLNERGEGVHHVGFLSPDLNYAGTIAEFEARGFHVEQSGRWMGKSGFAFLTTRDDLGLSIEIWDHAPGWTLPDPEEWIPSPDQWVK